MLLRISAAFEWSASRGRDSRAMAKRVGSMGFVVVSEDMVIVVVLVCVFVLCVREVFSGVRVM